MTDHHTATLDHYQGLVDQLADEDAALEKYRDNFAKQLMQEYLEDNHKLSATVAFWIKKDLKNMYDTQMEGYLFSALTDPDFNMGEVWRDWLTEKFEAMAKGMSSKEIDEYQREYF